MHGTGSGWRAGFSADWKTIAAIGFAAGGIGLAGWTVFGRSGGERVAAKRPAGAMTSTVDSAGMPTEAEYTKTKGRAASEVVAQLADSAAMSARTLPGFGSQGAGSSEAFAQSLRHAVEPFIAGDHGAFLEAMRALGATLPGEIDKENPLFVMLRDKLAGAEVDLTRLTVTAHEKQGGGVRLKRQEDNERSDAGSRRTTRERVAEMRPESLFAAAADAVDERAVDVRFPYRPKGEKDEQWFGVVLVWSPEAGAWQPGAFQFIKREVEVEP